MSGSNIREAIFKVAEWGVRGRLDGPRRAALERRAATSVSCPGAWS